MYYLSDMPKQSFSTDFKTRYEGGVKPFWTAKEYEYQNLILNGFVVHRELVGYAENVFPKARVDLYYDGDNGLGVKKIIGIEAKVYKEATKYLTRPELLEFNTKWTKAKYDGLFNYDDPLARQDISDSTIPPWHSDPTGWKRRNKNKVQERISSPLSDIFLTNNIDPKDIAGEGGLSSLYNYIQGKRELPKNKAEEYAELLGIAPQKLMFETKYIPTWGSVNLHNKQKDDDNNTYDVGEIKTNDVIYTIPCPAEIYQIDIKAVQVSFDQSAYHGFVAYYYETNSLAANLNNKLCMIRTYEALEDEKGNKFGPNTGYYKYYLGIYQTYGTKVRILNPDVTSDQRILADNVDVDLAAPIVAFVKPAYFEDDVVISRNIKSANVNKLKQLIAEDEKLKKEQAEQNKTLEKLSKFINEKFYKEKEAKKVQTELDKQVAIIKETEERLSQIQKDLERTLYKQRREITASDNVLKWTEEAKKRA